MTSGNNDKGRGRGNKGKDKVKNRVVSDDTPTQSPLPNATHVFRPQHPPFLSSGHTTMSPQYAPGITPSGRVFSSIPSQDDSSMPPPGYGYGYQHRSASGLHPSASPGYHIKTSRRPISSSRRSPSATPSPKEAYTRRMEEYIQSKGCNEQGEPYKPSDEEEIGIWLDVNGGVHKGRAYGLSSERSFHRLNSGLRGIGTSSDAEALDRATLESMQRKIAMLNEELEAAAVAREAERVRLVNDIASLKSQMKHFVRNVLPHSDED